MPSTYPDELDAFDEDHADEPNKLAGPDLDETRSAVNAIQKILGTLPQGAAATVKARIASVESRRRVLGEYSALTVGSTVFAGELVTVSGLLYSRLADGTISGTFTPANWIALGGADQVLASTGLASSVAVPFDLAGRKSMLLPVTLSGASGENRAILLSGGSAGAKLILQLFQDAAGGKTFSLQDADGSTTLDISPTASAMTIVQIEWLTATDSFAFVAGGNGGPQIVPTPPDAATGVKGITRLSVAPVSASAPIAVGANDPKVTADQAVGTASIRTLGTGAQQAAAGPHIHASRARRDIALLAAGVVSENAGLEFVSSGIAPVAGTIYGAQIGLLAGDVVTSLRVCTVTAGAGTAPTLIRLGLADSTGKIVALTANLNASANFTTANNPAILALSAPYTVPADGGYEIVFIQVGAWGTTQMTLGRVSVLANINLSARIAGYMGRCSTFGTGLSDLPAIDGLLGNPLVNGNTYYMAALA